MQFQKINNKGKATLFTNKYLEYFTKANPLVIWSMYVPIIICMLCYAASVCKTDAVYIILYFAGGIFFWTFFEYVMHRFAFHFIARSKTAMKIIYVIHGNHHEYPRDKERLFMPPLPSIILAITIFTSMYLIFNCFSITNHVFSFFPGFILGYLIYGTMHYAIHAWNPPCKWLKPLWRNHHFHHYKESHKGFGVSTTLWDRIFGTMYDFKKEIVDIEKQKELMFDPVKSKKNLLYRT